MELFLRVAALGLFVIWRIYWRITEKSADLEKPKSKEQAAFFSSKRLVGNFFQLLVGLGIILPLLGVKILPMDHNSTVPLFGFVLVLLGIGICIIARKELGTNWANAAEYQVKQKQTLTTTGIYSYVRNPIYFGLLLAAIGAGLVGESYIFLIFMACSVFVYIQSKREEKILEEHFGKEYRDYKKRSKMLIPFVF